MTEPRKTGSVIAQILNRNPTLAFEPPPMHPALEQFRDALRKAREERLDVEVTILDHRFEFEFYRRTALVVAVRISKDDRSVKMRTSDALEVLNRLIRQDEDKHNVVR